MKKLLRRTLGIVVGLTIGWLTAGWVLASIQTPHSSTPTVLPAGGVEEHHTTDLASDKGLMSAGQLVPTENTDWYRPVVGIAIGLFLAAILLGIPAMKMRGPEPAVSPDHDDSHDDAHSHAPTHGSTGHASHH